MKISIGGVQLTNSVKITLHSSTKTMPKETKTVANIHIIYFPQYYYIFYLMKLLIV